MHQVSQIMIESTLQTEIQSYIKEFIKNYYKEKESSETSVSFTKRIDATNGKTF